MENNKVIRVGQNPEVDFPSWMCEHAVPYERVREGDLRICMECLDLLDAGAEVVDKNSGAPVIWGEAHKKASLRRAGNALDELLGLTPGIPGVPEKIWKAVSQRMRETGSPVDLTFYHCDHEQTEGQLTVTYDAWQFESDQAGEEEVKRDCAALDKLGFNDLVRHSS